MIDYDDFTALAAVETPRRVRLSADSLTLFQSAFQWLRNPHEWEVGTDPLTTVQEDARDALVSQALHELEAQNVDIGLIFPYVTASPPVNSLACDGTHYLRVDYPELYAALDSAFIVDADHFATPDLQGRVMLGAGSGAGLSTYAAGAVGGAESHALTTAELASHNHGLTDPGHSHTITDTGHIHTVTDPGHNHTLTDPGHGHSINNPTHTHGTTDPGHVHTVTDPGHVHTIPHAAGTNNAPTGSGQSVAGPAAGGTGSTTTGVSVDSHTTGVTVNAAAANQTINNGATNVTLSSATTSLTVNNHATGITEASAVTGATVNNNGSGTAHENRQPYLALRFALWAK